MAEKKIIEIAIETADGVKNLNRLEAKFEDIYGDVLPLTGAVGELEDQLYQMARAGERGSKEFADLAKEVGRMKKTVIEVDAIVDGFAEGIGVSLGGSLEGVAGGFALAQGAMGAFGAESEKIEEAILRVQSAMAIAQGVESLRQGAKGFQALKTQAVGAFNGMTKASKAFAVTGIGLVLTAIASATVYFDDLKKIFTGVTRETEAMKETLEDYNSAAVDATKKVKDVGVAFELAKDGVISKQEALDKYNEELGGVLGQAKDLNEAEEIYRKKTDAYIKATALRAQADALLSKAAEEQVKGMTAAQENQVGAWDNAQAGLAAYLGFATVANDKLEEGQEKGIKRAKKQAKENADAFTKMAEDMMKEAAEIESSFAIDPVEEQKQVESVKQVSKAKIEAKVAELTKSQELEEEYYQRQLSQQEKEIYDLMQRYDQEIAIAEDNSELQQQLTEELQKNIADINDRYAQEAAEKERLRAEKLAAERQDRREQQVNNEILFQQRLAEVDNSLAATRRGNLDSTIEAFAQFSDKSKAIALAVIAVQKGLAIADVVSNTSKTLAAISASSAEVLAKKFAAYATVPGGQAIALAEAGPILAANAKLAAATKIGAGIQIASIAATGISEAAGVIGSSTQPTAGGGGASSVPSAQTSSPQFNVVGDTGVNQLAQTLGQQGQQPIQAYVVANNVTTAQSLERNKIENASL